MPKVRRWAGLVLTTGLATGCCSVASDPAPSAEETPEVPSASIQAGRAPADVRREGNHLVGEPSPYLEQHAHNPVDWHPWGKEALAKAKREHKPIFLSIGYSTCHWCHVMEKESFEDDEVAAFLNDNFISIKVDREQRPDVDALYLDAVAALGGSTGWPLTVFLTPKLEPYFGGTYFPRNAHQGRPGFLDVLREVDGMWRDHGNEVARRGREILAQIERHAGAAVGQPAAPTLQSLTRAIQNLASARDPLLGGFGQRQKFPNAPLLLAELRSLHRTNDADTRAHVVVTLEQIMRGGIRDHLAGTFHRYTVDKRWHVPHFEKMLYDNAQLAGLFIEAGRQLEREDFVRIGREVLDDLVAHWVGSDGGMVVGFDADDPIGEGAFYTWTRAELETVLGPEDGPLIADAFTVTSEGDPTLEGRSVLHRNSEVPVPQAILDRALPKLAEARRARPAPSVDDKQLVAWNALALMTLADAGRWLDEPRYVQAAERLGGFILDKAWRHGALSRGVRGGASLGPGFLDDYALAGLGLLRLHAATGELRWLTGAHELATAMRVRFYDAERAAFLQTAQDSELPVRKADMDDGVMPSGGSAAILLALELGAIAGDKALYEVGYGVLAGAAPMAERQPFSSGFLLVALDHVLGPVREVVVAGAPDDPATVSLWRQIMSTSAARILPVRIGQHGIEPAHETAFPALSGKKALRGVPTAFVCEKGSCQLPTSEPTTLRKQIEAVASH